MRPLVFKISSYKIFLRSKDTFFFKHHAEASSFAEKPRSWDITVGNNPRCVQVMKTLLIMGREAQNSNLQKKVNFQSAWHVEGTRCLRKCLA